MQTPAQYPWRPLSIAAASWVIGISCWFAVIACDALQILIRSSALSRNKHQRPNHIGSVLDSDYTVAVLYGACFFAGAFFIGRKSRNRKAILYVFGTQAIGASLLIAIALSHEIKIAEVVTLFIPVASAPLATWLANKIPEK